MINELQLHIAALSESVTGGQWLVVSVFSNCHMVAGGGVHFFIMLQSCSKTCSKVARSSFPGRNQCTHSSAKHMLEHNLFLFCGKLKLWWNIVFTALMLWKEKIRSDFPYPMDCS